MSLSALADFVVYGHRACATCSFEIVQANGGELAAWSLLTRTCLAPLKQARWTTSINRSHAVDLAEVLRAEGLGNRLLAGQTGCRAADRQDASEKSAGSLQNWVRVLDPQADLAANIAMLEAVRSSGYSGMDSMLWNPELANHRRDPAFQDFVRRTHMLAYWRVHAWPDRCKPAGAGVLCS